MIKTFAPVWAKLIAVLVAVVVLPSAGRLDVIRSVFGGCPAVERRIDVLSWRYASASDDRESALIRSSDGAGPSDSSPPAPTSSSLRRVVESIDGIAARA